MNSARRDLCGGYPVTGIPTATLFFVVYFFSSPDIVKSSKKAVPGYDEGKKCMTYCLLQRETAEAKFSGENVLVKLCFSHDERDDK